MQNRDHHSYKYEWQIGLKLQTRIKFVGKINQLPNIRDQMANSRFLKFVILMQNYLIFHILK